jgi:DNA primase
VISQESIERVRSQANLAQIVGERVKLERRGRSLIGLCPFHKEKSPSFHVNEERGFYYCFGCHASGDGLKFLQETEGLSFVEAVRVVAQKLGIELVETRSDADRRQDDDARRRREELFSANQEAANYFIECLAQHPLASIAHAELERRGLGDTTDVAVRDALTAFKVGYAPLGWDGLVNHLRRSGLSVLAAEKVGIIAARKTGGGHYDRFRHRLMFAILDLSGKVIGFSGRELRSPTEVEFKRAGIAPLGTTEEAVAKYMNSPESQIYKKRETVFGLFQARAAVRELNNCVLVEGNFDVLSLHARGVLNVVAPLGTAFTQEQAAQIKRYTPNVTLLFDGDSAGRRASAASREPCRVEGLNARVASLPPGTDPDDLIQKKGPEAIRQCVRNARGMLEYLIESSLDSGFKSEDVQAQSAKIGEVLALIAEEQDPTLRALAQTHADTVAARLGIKDARSLTALHRAIRQASGSPQPSSKRMVAPPESARSQGRAGAIEEETLGAFVEFPELLQDPELQPLLGYAQGTLALGLATLARAGGQLIEHLPEMGESLRHIVSERLAAPQLKDALHARDAIRKNLQKLASADTRRFKEQTIELLHQARRVGDIEKEMELLAKLTEYSQRRPG